MSRYLIVGGVAAGMSAAARLRRLDETADIIVFERGAQISYANCGLPYYIGGVIHERNQLLLQTPARFKQRFNVDVRVHSEVLAIEPSCKLVRVRDLSTGREYEERYDRLLLAPGGSPVRPPIPGADHPAVHTLWTMPDTDRLRALVDQGKVKTALLVGAGFIGLEMAENLHARGIRVVVVELARQALSPLDYEMAAVVHQELRRQGIELHLEESVTAFEQGPDHGVKARLAGGGVIGADLVLLSIGVQPNTGFLAGSGIRLGPRGHIVVDPALCTSVADIYAAGDAIAVIQPLTGKPTAIPLAGPANKQGRIAAGNLCGKQPRTYGGTIGTAIAKIFDLDVGMTGATEKFCRAEGLAHRSVIVHPYDHAGYYPGATALTLKLVFSPETRKVLGAQAIGYAGVDKRIDVIATAIMAGMTVDELTEIEHAYAPPYSSAKDPVNMAGFVAQNLLDGVVRTISWDEVPAPDPAAHCLLDVRTPDEFAAGTIPGAVNIPLDELRGRLGELPPVGQPVVTFCQTGVRSYLATRILMAHGWADCANLSGGYETWRLATLQESPVAGPPGDQAGGASVPPPRAQPNNVIKVDACGLQCPGPIMRLKQEMERLTDGETLAITASDPGFYSDAPAWARTSGHTLREISISKGLVTAVIEKGHGPQGTVAAGGNDKTIVVFSGDLDKAIASFIIANGALAMGRKVTMFFTFWGLNVLRRPEKVPGVGKNLVEAAFGWMMPRGSGRLPLSRMNLGGIGSRMIRGIMQRKQVPALEEMMATAIRHGATLVACQMSMELMGIQREELIDGIQVGGVATYLEASERADNNLFI